MFVVEAIHLSSFSHARWPHLHHFTVYVPRPTLCFRIPLGFWSVPITSASTNYSTSTSPFIPGAWPYLLRALNWAKTHGVHVIVDLHGAPGSQNGFDNSGQSTGSPAWASDQDNVPRTLDIIRYIAENIGGIIDVLELLNEPVGWRSDIGTAIRSYWQNGYNAVRQADGGGIQIMIGDAFLGVQVCSILNTYIFELPYYHCVMHSLAMARFSNVSAGAGRHYGLCKCVLDPLFAYLTACNHTMRDDVIRQLWWQCHSLK